MQNFDALGLSTTLSQSLANMKYDTPTPIQAQSIPPALEGRDIMGTAQTGTGKTAAYSIPLVEHLINNERSTALVLTPTRELGKQVMEVITQMLWSQNKTDKKIRTAFIIGGEPYRKQLMQLEKRPRLIVGTPGRINDHLERNSLELDLADFLVLDETDRMLDMGFSVQLDRIFKYLPKKRQTLMFSATLPNEIMGMSKKYLNNPERVKVGSTEAPAVNIKQEVIRIDDGAKYAELNNQLNNRMGSIIIFVKTKHGTERLAKRLQKDGHEAQAIHGDLKQNRRERVIKNFRDQQFRILVATDVVARGLDIPHIQHVVNYDLPQVAEDFIHRIGRTARAGAEGEALSFVSPREALKWNAIEMLIDPNATPMQAEGGSRGGPRRPNRNKPRSGASAGSGEKRDFKRSGGDRKPSNGRGRPERDANTSDGGKKRKPNKRKDFYEAKEQASGDSAGKKNFDNKKSDWKKPDGKKPYGKKPFDKKSDSRDGDSKKPFAKKSGGKPNGGKFGDKSEGKYEGKSGGKPAGKSFGDKKKFGDKKEGGGYAGLKRKKPNKSSSGKSSGKPANKKPANDKPKKQLGASSFKKKS